MARAVVSVGASTSSKTEVSWGLAVDISGSRAHASAEIELGEEVVFERERDVRSVEDLIAAVRELAEVIAARRDFL